MRVLLAEDEKKISSFIAKALTEAGCTVCTFADGSEALEQLGRESFDVVVLDIMLPGCDGLTVLRSMRKGGITTPVLLLTARAGVEERVEGLNAGADDYLPKPFALDELVARVRALGRRTPEAKPVLLRFADLVLDTTTMRAERAGKTIDLSLREYRLLEFLLRAPGRVRDRDAILKQVCDYDFDAGASLVENLVRQLRIKIDGNFNLKLLQTISGVGYTLREKP